MIQMAFNVIGYVLNNRDNITLLARKEEEVWWYGFAFGFSIRSNIVFIKGRQYHKDYIQ